MTRFKYIQKGMARIRALSVLRRYALIRIFRSNGKLSGRGRNAFRNNDAFEDLAESVTELVVRYGPDLRRVYVNSAFADYARKSRQELLYCKTADSPVPNGQHASILERLLKKTFETGRKISAITTTRVDEAPQVFETTLIPEFGDSGAVASVLLVSRNATGSRALAESALAIESEFKSLADNIPDSILRFGVDGRLVYMNAAGERVLETPVEDRLGKTVREFYAGNLEMEPYAAAIDEVIESGVSKSIEVTLSSSGGASKTYRVAIVPEFDGERVVCSAVAIIRDISANKYAEAKSREHLRLLESMNAVNDIIQGSTELPQMLRAVLSFVKSALDCDRAFLLYPCDPYAPSWSIPFQVASAEHTVIGNTGVEVPMSDEASNQIAIIKNMAGDVDCRGRVDCIMPTVFEKFNIKSQAAMAIFPKAGKPWVFGVHQCTYEREWTQNEISILKEIGWRLSDGISSLLVLRDIADREEQLSKLSEQLRCLVAQRELIQEGERKRISREIHDELGQNLTALSLGVFKLSRSVENASLEFKEEAERLNSLIKETVEKVRDIATALRPSVLDTDIVSAVSWLASATLSETGIAFRVKAPRRRIVLDEDVKLTVFRVTQEALTNIVRHAGATKAVICLQVTSAACVVKISDDGIGFAPERISLRSLGLLGMRERVGMLQGDLSVESSPGNGTTITATVPIRGKDGGHD